MPALLEAGCHAFWVFHLLPVPRPLAGQGFLGWKHEPVCGFFWQKQTLSPAGVWHLPRKQKGPGVIPGAYVRPGRGPGTRIL